MRYRCPLGSLQPKEMDKDRIKRDAWHTDGILVVSLDDDRLDFVDRQFVQRLGDRLFGKGNG